MGHVFYFHLWVVLSRDSITKLEWRPGIADAEADDDSDDDNDDEDDGRCSAV